MAQQASPIGIGQRELLRIQLIAASRRVKITLPSIFESYATGLVCLIQRTYFSSGNRQEQICEIVPACRLEFPVRSWHVCHMDLAKESYRLMRRACAALLILSSCAHRTPPGRAEAGVSPGSAALIATAEGSHKAPAAIAVPQERRATLQAAVPRKEPTKAEQIIALVREGYFVDEAKGALVFSRARPTGVSGSGLYEDAILLGRLRRALKETDGIPDSLSAMATVRDARAFLKIDDTLPAPSAARAIDAALRTPGVNSVQARIAG